MEIADKVQNSTEPTEDTTDNKVETNTENVIGDSNRRRYSKKKTSWYFSGQNSNDRKLSVKVQDISVDLAMPLNENSVLNVKKADESQEKLHRSILLRQVPAANIYDGRI